MEQQYKEETITLQALFARCGITDLTTPDVIDCLDDGYEIESYDVATKTTSWSPISCLVVKNTAPEHYRLGSLCGTGAHRVLHNESFVPLCEHPFAVKVESPIQVLDITVPGSANYLAEGQINHNTTTPGGKAVPYHASLRIKLGAGAQIKKTVNGKEVVVGINVSAKTIKNKVARPWREVDFEIIFGKGIEEGEQLFDALREFCEKTHKPCVLDGKKIMLSGTSAWKNFVVSDTQTGEVIEDVKFHKSEFEGKVANVPEFKPYMDALMDACFIMTNEDDEHHTKADVDTNSAEEVEAAEIG